MKRIPAGAVLGAVIVLLGAPPSLSAQYARDAVRPFWGIGGPGSRAEGMAQAFTAIADDGNALYYNPAGLAHLTATEFNVGLSHLNTGTQSGASALANPSGISATRLGNLSVVLPMPGNKWTIAAGVFNIRDFERSQLLQRSFGDTLVTETLLVSGRLTALSVGMGYQVSPRLAVGYSAELISGNNRYDDAESALENGNTIASTFTHIEPNYIGMSIRFGILLAPRPTWRVGLMVRPPLKLAVRETFYDDIDPSETEIEYEITQPFLVRLGTALNLGPLLISGDLQWQDFSQIRFESDLVDEFVNSAGDTLEIPIDAEINITLRTQYRSVLGVAVGAELLLPVINMKLRGGYRYRPQFLGGATAESAHQTFTLGASVAAVPGVKLDLAYSLTLWERDLSSNSIYWQSGINPLRGTAGRITANLVLRL